MRVWARQGLEEKRGERGGGKKKKRVKGGDVPSARMGEARDR